MLVNSNSKNHEYLKRDVDSKEIEDNPYQYNQVMCPHISASWIFCANFYHFFQSAVLRRCYLLFTNI